MGMNLFDEFADHAPDELTPRERWVGGILAKDANDVTRLTFHSVESEKILRKARVNRREMYKILARLQATKVLEKGTSGFTNQRATYRFLPMATAESVSKTDTQSEEGGEFGHPQGEEEGVQTGYDCGSELGKEGVQNGYERVFSSDTPSPPSPSPPPLPPSGRGIPEQQDGERAGGREDTAPSHEEEQRPREFAVLAEIIARHPQLVLGERDIESLASTVRLWLERATPAHLELAVTQGLPATIASPAGFVRRRLLDKMPPALPRAPLGAPEASGSACTMCRHVRAVALEVDGVPYCAACAPRCRGCGERASDDVMLDGECADCRQRSKVAELT